MNLLWLGLLLLLRSYYWIKFSRFFFIIIIIKADITTTDKAMLAETQVKHIIIMNRDIENFEVINPHVKKLL